MGTFVALLLLCSLFIFITPLNQYKVWLGLPNLYKEAAIDAGNGFKYIPVFNKFGLVKILPYDKRFLVTTIGAICTLLLLLYFYFKKSTMVKLFTVAIFCTLSFIILPYEYLMLTAIFALFSYVYFESI